MTRETELRFELKITDRETGEVITQDWTTFCATQIDQFGAVETIDNHTGAALRYVRRQANRGE